MVLIVWISNNTSAPFHCCRPLFFFPFTASCNAQYLDKIDQRCWVIIVATLLANPILLIGWFCCSGAALVRCVCQSKSLNEEELTLFLKEKLFQIWLNLISRKELNCESFSFTPWFILSTCVKNVMKQIPCYRAFFLNLAVSKTFPAKQMKA